MKIISCNVNGIRSALSKGFWQWLMAQKADFICLQEIRAHWEVVPEFVQIPKGYHACFLPAKRPGYSGVALFSLLKPDKVFKGLGWPEMDDEGRYLQADFKNLSVVSVYFPSGTSGEERQKLKYRFMDVFYEKLLGLRRKKREYIFCGDFNIAHKEIDIKNPKANEKNSGFLPEERAWMDRLFEALGYVDAFRVVNQQPAQYTWWSNRGRAYEKNVGWRIDYQVVSPEIRFLVKEAEIYKGEKFSDHAPLTIYYENIIKRLSDKEGSQRSN